MQGEYKPISNMPSQPVNQYQPQMNNQAYVPPQGMQPQPQGVQPSAQPQPNLGQIAINPVQNQLGPAFSQPVVVQLTFKTSSLLLTCPVCRNTAMTNVVKNLSCCNLCCCLWTSCFCWMCFQCCRGKDLSCNNATHYCSVCSSKVGEYKAC